MIDKWVTSLRFNEINNENKFKINLCWFLCLVWRVSAVTIFDCSLNVYACGRQKGLSIPAYCVAANCNNSQATQNLTTHEFPRNRPAVRRKWVKFVQSKRADFHVASQSRPWVWRALGWVQFHKLYGGIPKFNGTCFKAETLKQALTRQRQKA